MFTSKSLKNPKTNNQLHVRIRYLNRLEKNPKVVSRITPNGCSYEIKNVIFKNI